MSYSDYCERGFCRFAYDERLQAWVDGVSQAAEATLTDPRYSHWWRCGGTWFAGVNVLDNDADGRCGDSPALQGEAHDFIARHVRLSHDSMDRLVLDKAQISVCTEAYPKRGDGESDAAHGFRLKRDAAHLDGLLKEDGRRHLREYHGFILGIAMNDVPKSAAPFVVYEKSHKAVQAWLQKRLGNIVSDNWGDEDLTEEYKALRKQVFNDCRRVELPISKGESFLVHRFAIHGTAVWQPGIQAAPRMLAFFRPPITTALNDWLVL